MLNFIGNVIFYFFLLGFVGRFAVDIFVGVLDGIGIKPPDVFSSHSFVGFVVLFLLVISVALAKFLPIDLDD